MTITCRIDWSWARHDLAVMDGDGKLICRGKIGTGVAGFGELMLLPAERCDDPASVPVAIETDKNAPHALPVLWRSRKNTPRPNIPKKIGSLVIQPRQALAATARQHATASLPLANLRRPSWFRVPVMDPGQIARQIGQPARRRSCQLRASLRRGDLGGQPAAAAV
jgi:hypothetical protein